MIAIMFNHLIETLWGASSRDQALAAGEVLFRAGDPVRLLYLVTAGEVRLVRSLAHGLQLTIQRAGPGAILAEASLLAGSYHCEAVAAGSSRLRATSVARIKSALAADPVLAQT